MTRRHIFGNKGFTLIEMLIVVAIMGILMVIAIPNYNEYMIRATRTTAQQFLLDVAQRQEQYLLDNRQYATKLINGPGGLGFGANDAAVKDRYPDVSNYYNLPLPDLLVDNAATPPTFVILLTPRAGRMNADGDLIINNRAEKWRETDGNKTYNAGTDKQW